LHKTSTAASSDYNLFGFSEIYVELVVSSPTLYTGKLGFHTNNSSGRGDQGEIISKFYQPSFITKGSLAAARMALEIAQVLLYFRLLII